MMRISRVQLITLVASSVIANGILSLPQVAAGIGGPGGWLVVVAVGLYSVIQILFLALVCRRFPNVNFIDLTKKVLGGFTGTIIAVLLIIYFTLLASLVARGVANAGNTTVYTSTPPLVLMGVMVLISVYAVYHGLEVLARVNLILFVIKMLIFFPVMLVILPQVDWGNLLPLWERGTISWVEGLLNIQSSFAGFIIFAFAYPHLQNPKGGVLAGIYALVSVTIVYTIVTVLAILVFSSEEVARMNWPVIFLIRVVAVPVDAPYMAFWVASAFSVISSSIFMACYTLEKLFKLRDYRYFLPPLAVIVIAVALIPKSNLETATFAVNLAYLGASFEWVLPMVLLVMAVIGNKRETPA
ncbi:spore germination protein KB [Desulfohalotomaculum tongense]|uniref:GerAB/ArcD/ProY family transporter n=1 Tax=Desulforadius tongensis TaxID=1216062 RepID=UPI001956B0E6|nr:endospore germination permease [Desulforadius tongensis]MBM7855680.1 spore germination protein KB [Desulforadius tongensis]